jgi:hypothetical protein
MTSKQHGGKRPNAGRKPSAIRKQAITIRLTPEDADRLRKACQDAGLSQSGWLKRVIRAQSRML